MPGDVLVQVLLDGRACLLQPLSGLRLLVACEHLPIDDVEQQQRHRGNQ